MANDAQILDHAFQNSLNVLLRGKHGVGKTAMVKECLTEQGLILNQNWLYFSAATMDPWVDFIGVPKEKTDANGNSHLVLVRPEALQNDKIQIIFFDELNRSHKKIRNAVMELIQFGSINGKEFKNLKCIWAAINPDDDDEVDYDVEKLDPAQIDRFQIQIDVPYRPSHTYFKKVYGSQGVFAVKWWTESSKEVKDLISPRRLEYALQMIAIGGDIKTVLNSPKINVTELKSFLDKGDPLVILDDLLNDSDQKVQLFFADHNSLSHVRKELLGKTKYLNRLAPMLPDEEILKELKPKKRSTKLAEHVVKYPEKYDRLMDVVLNNRSGYHAKVGQAFGRLHEKRKKTLPKPKPTNTGSGAFGKNTLTISGQEVDARTMTFCFTGTLANYNRAQAQAMVKQRGANVAATVTNLVTHVVSTSTTNFKAKKAARLNLCILTEKEFENMFKQVTQTRSDTININGKDFKVADLNMHNFYSETGRRFRATKEQMRKMQNGTMTRNEAFAEFLNGYVTT